MMIEECLVVEFRVTGEECPLAAASRATGATVDAASPQLRADGNTLVRCTAPVDAGVGRALDADERVAYLHASRTDGRETYRFLSREPCVVHQLTNAGFLAESLQYRGGDEYHAGAVVGLDVLEGVLAAAGETVGVNVERVSPLGRTEESSVAPRWELTPAQREALEASLAAGYFEIPRASTASEVAERLGISKSAFLERLRRAEAVVISHIVG